MEDKTNKKTVLFVCISAIGHVNSVTGIANHLKELGHRTVFLFNKPFGSKLKRFGHEVYDCLTPDLVESPCHGLIPNRTSQMILDTNRDSWVKGCAVENVEILCDRFMPEMLAEYTPEHDKNVAAKLKLLKPDLLVIDHFYMYPALSKLRLPCVRVYSPAPLQLHSGENGLPQPWLGLPTEWDRSDPVQVEWNERVQNARQRVMTELMTPFWESYGLPDLLPDRMNWYFPYAADLQLYMCSEELDYEQPLVGWNRFDFSIRDQPANKFELPEKLRNQPGKLIFLSLGSLASADGQLMGRLTSMLADCPHKFIVVTGSSRHEYELPDNMWGQEYLPQLEILPIIDLIITHGGNNTVCESLYFGVPGMIVCPLFGDQLDNAQRVQETGLGIRLDPYNCTKGELHGAIEDLLSRPGLRERMQAISERMQQPETRDKPLKLIRDFVDRM